MNVRDDAPPWSFFIPVTLAVMVGVLAADGIRYAIGTVFDTGDASGQAVRDTREAAPPAPAPSEASSVADGTSADGMEREGLEVSASEDGPRETAPPSALVAASPAADELDDGAQDSGVRELPDSMTARRDGDPEACVNGTVVRRVEGGWEQALEHDAPIPCVIVHR